MDASTALSAAEIKNFIRKELANNARYQELAVDAPAGAVALEEEVAATANGAFLWVRLVVGSLLSGLGEQDSIHDLQIRFRTLPIDLENLLHHILMNSVDMDKASMMFKIVRQASQSQLSVFALALTDNFYSEKATSSPIRPWASAEISKACQDLEDLMKVQCAGLIEVSGTVKSTLHGSICEKALGEVQYLHPTIKRYLERPEIRELIDSYASKTKIDANISLLQSYLLQLKTIPHHSASGEVWGLARDAMQYASRASISTASHLTLIAQLGQTIKAHKKTYPSLYPEQWSQSFLAVAVQYNLWLYVETQLGSQDLLKQGVTVRTLLAYALGARGFQNYDLKHNKEMVCILLKHATKDGTKKDIWKMSNIWQQVLQSLEQGYLEPDSFAAQFEVVKLFLQFGADPLVMCQMKDGRELDADTIIRRGLEKYPHRAADDILGLLDAKESEVRVKGNVIQRLSSWSLRKPKIPQGAENETAPLNSPTWDRI